MVKLGEFIIDWLNWGKKSCTLNRHLVSTLPCLTAGKICFSDSDLARAERILNPLEKFNWGRSAVCLTGPSAFEKVNRV